VTTPGSFDTSLGFSVRFLSFLCCVLMRIFKDSYVIIFVLSLVWMLTGIDFPYAIVRSLFDLFIHFGFPRVDHTIQFFSSPPFFRSRQRCCFGSAFSQHLRSSISTVFRDVSAFFFFSRPHASCSCSVLNSAFLDSFPALCTPAPFNSVS